MSHVPHHLASNRSSLWLILGFWSLLALVTWAFLPGLGGTLIFDDIPNLQPWQDLGDIDSVQKAITFAVSGSGAPGRPLSLLTFLVDDQSWVPDIYSLKRTNLAIHLLNSCLVFWLCLKLLQHLLPTRSARQQGIYALLVTAIWSLHPLQVSNVSYIIQRMNLLSTLLELGGLLLFIRGRELLSSNPYKALILCSLAIGIFMPSSVLAKENGLLLCAFVLLAETFCFARNREPIWRIWKGLFLWLPLLAFVIYCLVEFRFFTMEYPNRNFNSWERLLTQGPVVNDYLNKLLLPRLHGSGLYFDNFPVSRSLIQPWSTLVCWGVLAALLAAAWHLRQRLPLFAFGIFFYFSGHLMESTVVPLELYFEHRNYLPQLGLWLALVALFDLITNTRIQKIMALATLLLVGLLSMMTRHNADLWGKPELQASVWYHDNPGSLRTTLAYADLLMTKGEYSGVQKTLSTGLDYYPDSLILVISKRFVECYWENRPVAFDDLPALARHADHEYASIVMLEKMRKIANDATADTGNCKPASNHEIGKIYLALLDNPRFNSDRTRSRLFEFMAEISVKQGKLNEAMGYYDKAFSISRNPIYPYRQALLLKSAGLPELSQDFIDSAKKSLGLRQKASYPELESRLLELEKTLPRREKSGDNP